MNKRNQALLSELKIALGDWIHSAYVLEKLEQALTAQEEEPKEPEYAEPEYAECGNIFPCMDDSCTVCNPKDTAQEGEKDFLLGKAYHLISRLSNLACGELSAEADLWLMQYMSAMKGAPEPQDTAQEEGE